MLSDDDSEEDKKRPMPTMNDHMSNTYQLDPRETGGYEEQPSHSNQRDDPHKLEYPGLTSAKK
jgi:hypothetical protein